MPNGAERIQQFQGGDIVYEDKVAEIERSFSTHPSSIVVQAAHYSREEYASGAIHQKLMNLKNVRHTFPPSRTRTAVNMFTGTMGARCS
jgi:hypothetical protein